MSASVYMSGRAVLWAVAAVSDPSSSGWSMFCKGESWGAAEPTGAALKVSALFEEIL